MMQVTANRAATTATAFRLIMCSETPQAAALIHQYFSSLLNAREAMAISGPMRFFAEKT
jgi:hypothetical protein